MRHKLWSVRSCTAAAAKPLQSCPTLCDPIDGSPLGSPVPGILQARVLQWGAIAFSVAHAHSTLNHSPGGRLTLRLRLQEDRSWNEEVLPPCGHFLYLQLEHMHNQIKSVAQSCPTLCDPMNRSTPGLHVHHQLPEFTQTHVHRVSDAIQPSHPLSSPSPPAPNPSQHQSLFQ